MLKVIVNALPMGNALPHVQACAKGVAPANSQDGAAWAIREQILPRCPQ